MLQTDMPTATQYADRIRLRAVQMVRPHGFGYLGQALSSAEQFSVLYRNHYLPARDHLVVSPGHYVIAAFAAGPEVGLLDPEQLDTYGLDESELEAIGTEKSPAVALPGGALGMGRSGALGVALADRIRNDGHARTFVVVSDGELEEGQMWEAAMFAAHHRLAAVTVLLDANDSQVDGPVSTITTLDPIADKWRACGWAAFDVDGHDVGARDAALAAAVDDPRPAVVIARTSTVHGLSVLPPDADGHFIKLPAELARAAVDELEARLV